MHHAWFLCSDSYGYIEPTAPREPNPYDVGVSNNTANNATESEDPGKL